MPGVMRLITASTMLGTVVAVVVNVPETHFAEKDDISLAAGKYVCTKLEAHLVQNGYSIPARIRGGCDEDWGVYFESTMNGTTYKAPQTRHHEQSTTNN